MSGPTQAAGQPCVAYYRVSTEKQGRSGLGLDAQRSAVARHIAQRGGCLASEFVEVESGRKKDRPQLAAALAAARAHRAVLVIAKLDRLARNVHFVSGLMESGVEFVAADMPTVNRLTVHILAAVAEEEARMISARTKAALAAAKARGVRLGNPNLARRLAGAGARRQRREDRAGAGAGGRRAALHRAGPARRRHHLAAARRRAGRARRADPVRPRQALAPRAGGTHRWAVSRHGWRTWRASPVEAAA